MPIKPTFKISVDREKCTLCQACVNICPEEIFRLQSGRVEIFKPGLCQVCGHCVAACKFDAISHNHLPLKSCPLPSDEQTVSAGQLSRIFRSRRSVRNFTAKPVAKETIEELVSIARWVPSSQNKQRVDWLVFDKESDITYLSGRVVEVLYSKAKLIQNKALQPFVRLALGRSKFLEAQSSAHSFVGLYQQLQAGQDPIFYNAPALLIAHGPKSYFGRDDAIYALYNMMLAAERMGLGTCQIGYFIVALDNDAKLRQELNLPRGHLAQAALILGYPKHTLHRFVPRRTPIIRWGSNKIGVTGGNHG